MAYNLQTSTSDDQVLTNCELQQTASSVVETQSANGIYDKQQFLVDKANSTFQELCKTLENEQAKLLELEERRKRLQEEMQLLKAEIEEEKQSFHLNIVQSVAENLSALNKTNEREEKESDQKQSVNERFNNLYTCYEDEETVPVTARNVAAKSSREFLNEEPNIQEHVQYIRNELQSVLTECITEQRGYNDLQN